MRTYFQTCEKKFDRNQWKFDSQIDGNRIPGLMILALSSSSPSSSFSLSFEFSNRSLDLLPLFERETASGHSWLPVSPRPASNEAQRLSGVVYERRSSAFVWCGMRVTKFVAWTQIVHGILELIATIPYSPSAGGIEQAITSVGGGGGPFSSSSSSLSSTSSSPFLVEETGVEGYDSGTGLNNNVGKWPTWNKRPNGALELNRGIKSIRIRFPLINFDKFSMILR